MTESNKRKNKQHMEQHKETHKEEHKWRKSEINRERKRK